MPVQNIIEFIQYIIPGFIAILVYRDAFPSKERDSFTEISSCILLGLITMSTLRWIDENCLNFFFETNSLKNQGPKFYLGIILFGGIAGLLGIGWVKIRSLLAQKFKFFSFLSKSPEPVWKEINKNTQGDWAAVFLNDNSIYLGWIKRYSYNPYNEDQEFLLIQAEKVDEKLSTIYKVSGLGVYLNTKNVNRIEFIKVK